MCNVVLLAPDKLTETTVPGAILDALVEGSFIHLDHKLNYHVARTWDIFRLISLYRLFDN